MDKTSSLPVKYSAPGVDESFDQAVRKQLEHGGSWADTLPEGRAESVTKRQKVRELAESPWDDEAKELALSNILRDADYDRLLRRKRCGILRMSGGRLAKHQGRGGKMPHGSETG